MAYSSRKLRIGIVVVSTNEKHFLIECLNSLSRQTYRNFEIIVIDNKSTDGSLEFIKQNYPKITILRNKKNLGFARSNNYGIQYAFKRGVDACLILNPDTVSDPHMLVELIKTLRSKMQEGNIGAVQPLLRLYSEPDLVNSAGNPIHYLGYGYAGSYLKKVKSQKNDSEILSFTGGAVLLTRIFFEKTGGFDPNYFMYCEDQALSWVGQLLNFKFFLSHKAYVYHKYNFSRNNKKMFYSERNRLFMLTENYSIKTIILLLPILILNEAFAVTYSILNGWFLLKMQSYTSFILNLPKLIRKRNIIQSQRKIKDKDIFSRMISELDFEPMNTEVLKLINKLYFAYYRLISPLI